MPKHYLRSTYKTTSLLQQLLLVAAQALSRIAMFHHLTALFKIYRLDVDCSGYRSESSVVRSTFEPPNKVTWPIGMAIFIALLLGVGLSRYQARSQNSRQVYANFIVSVLEAKGHPVAGVSVYLNDRPIGVTDSHGEWRRFMAVESHRLLEIKFVKDGQSPTLRGNLHVAVPKADPSLEEFSVRRRILLSATDETDLMGPVSSPLRLVTTIPDRGPLPLLQRYIGQASVIKNADSPFLNDDQFQLAPSTLYELLFGVPSFTVHSFSGGFRTSSR